MCENDIDEFLKLGQPPVWEEGEAMKLGDEWHVRGHVCDGVFFGVVLEEILHGDSDSDGAWEWVDGIRTEDGIEFQKLERCSALWALHYGHDESTGDDGWFWTLLCTSEPVEHGFTFKVTRIDFSS